MKGAASWTRGAGASTNGPIIASSGCLSMQNGGNTQTQPHTTPGGGDLAIYFDASKSSSVYQDNVSEVRVNALFGLSLIRAYQ